MTGIKVCSPDDCRVDVSLMMLFAFAVDAAVYALVGAAIVFAGRRALPEPWNQPQFTIPFVVSVGLILSLATFPHWFFWPK